MKNLNLYLSKVVNLKPAWLLEASSSPFLLHGMVFFSSNLSMTLLCKINFYNPETFILPNFIEIWIKTKSGTEIVPGTL